METFDLGMPTTANIVDYVDGLSKHCRKDVETAG
jgi:hypothetical protein